MTEVWLIGAASTHIIVASFLCAEVFKDKLSFKTKTGHYHTDSDVKALNKNRSHYDTVAI